MGGKVVADAVLLLAFAKSFGAGWRGEWAAVCSGGVDHGTCAGIWLAGFVW